MIRGISTALGLCTRGPGRVRASYPASGFNAMIYGGKVFAELRERGVSLQDITTAGQAAYELMTGDLLTEKEIEEAVGNSEDLGETSPE